MPMEMFNYFERRGAGLFVEDVPVAEIARREGTPVYIYSARSLRARYQYIYKSFSDALPGLTPIVAFSVKACSNLGILNLLAREGAHFDVVSGGELLRVARAGGDTRKVIFAGVGKRDDELELALDADVLQINVESRGELDRLQTIAARRGVQARVALRVNPEVAVHTHKHLTTGARASKFGMLRSVAAEILRNHAKFSNIQFKGLHVHVGSMLQIDEPYLRAVENLAELIASFPGGVATLDVGGGFAIPRAGEQGLDPRALAAALSPILLKIGATPILEPGRWIAAPSGALLTKTIDCKQSGDRKILIVDAAMNDLIRPALYDAVHPVEMVNLKNQPSNITEKFDLAGPVCESGDFLGRDVVLPPCEPGDLLLIRDAGAYGFSMSSNYNSRPRPAEILVDGATTRVIRARESMEDLWRGEHP